MGDPKKQRRKYDRPRHPWKAERITQETEIAEKYGLVNRKEIWKAKSKTDRFRKGARKFMGSLDEESEKKKTQLLTRLNKIGLIDSQSLEDVLRLKTEDLLERRLQTIAYRKGLANTIKQARQFIVHGHVQVGDRVVNVPSYIIEKDSEDTIKLKKEMNITKPTEKKKEEKKDSEESVKPKKEMDKKKPSEKKKEEKKDSEESVKPGKKTSITKPTEKKKEEKVEDSKAENG